MDGSKPQAAFIVPSQLPHYRETVTRPLPKLLHSLNAYLIEHPVASWIMWSLGTLIVIPSISFVIEPASERFGLLSWISLAGFVTVLLYFHPRVLPLSHRDAVGIRWAVAQIAWLFPEAVELLMPLAALATLAGVGSAEQVMWGFE